MIKIVDGNILDAPENIICHQVNCVGVMGAGLAKQIRDKYPEVYKIYRNLVGVQKHPRDLLGSCQFVRIGVNNYIGNLFSQYAYGTDVRHTDYDALDKTLRKVKKTAREHTLSVALPYNIGCGLAGGDWNVVYKIIEEVFGDYDVTIYKLQ